MSISACVRPGVDVDACGRWRHVSADASKISDGIAFSWQVCECVSGKVMERNLLHIDEVLLDASIAESRIVVEKLDEGKYVALNYNSETAFRRQLGIPLRSKQRRLLTGNGLSKDIIRTSGYGYCLPIQELHLLLIDKEGSGSCTTSFGA